MTQKEVERKIKELLIAKEKEKNAKKRYAIGKQIYHYKNYDKRLELQRNVNAKKRGKKHYSKLEKELIECKSTDHIKLDADSLRYMMG